MGFSAPAAFLGVAVLATAGCGGSASPPRGTEPPRTGPAIFADTGCGTCHTFAPAGATATIDPTPLTETRLDVAGIERVLRKGRSTTPSMPAYEEQLDDQQIRALAVYIARYAKP